MSPGSPLTDPGVSLTELEAPAAFEDWFAAVAEARNWSPKTCGNERRYMLLAWLAGAEWDFRGRADV